MNDGDRPEPGVALAIELSRHQRWFVLTGAGVSTESGIPSYRDEEGRFVHRQPVRFQEFVTSERVRRRYWARSAVGYERIKNAQPNQGHRALAELERLGLVSVLVTQNVDGLHQRAGSRRVIDLHGALSRVECLSCGDESSRDDLQVDLRSRLPSRPGKDHERPAPDGDALIEGLAEEWPLPSCRSCGGTLKPAVVFFGETVPRPRVDAAYHELDEASALLVVGSSLMVFSGYRFVHRAARRQVPIVVVNTGRTRADSLAGLKLEGRCGDVLDSAVRALGGRPPPP